jgi:hypothetical protein
LVVYNGSTISVPLAKEPTTNQPQEKINTTPQDRTNIHSPPPL